MKHKHNWQFVEKYPPIGPNPMNKEIYPARFKFVCVCGEVKMVEEKRKLRQNKAR